MEDIPKKRLKSNLEDKSTSIPDGETLPAKARQTKIQSRGNDLKKQKGKDVNLDIENARAPTSAPTSVSDDECEDSEHDEENGRPTLLHESLANDPKKRTKQKTRKHVPEDETPEMRDRRTIFVGNLPLDVLSKKVNQVFSVLEFFWNCDFLYLAAEETVTTTYPVFRHNCQNRVHSVPFDPVSSTYIQTSDFR